MNQEEIPISLNSKLLDEHNDPENGPSLSINFQGYHIQNLEKMEWVLQRLIEMGFQKSDILPIMNSNEIHNHEDKEEDLIFNFVFMMLLETPPGKSNIDPDSQGNLSLVITSQIRSQKEEKSRKNQEINKENGFLGVSVKNEEKSFICGICFSFENSFEFIPKCRHQFCEDCLMKYLIYSIENDSQKLIDLPCPETTCKKKLPLSFIEKKLSKNELFLTKFKKYTKTAKFIKNPSYRPCIKPNCENYVKKPFFGNKTNCLCGQIMCFKCRKPWHEGQNCSYEAEQNELDFLSYQKKNNLKFCPKCQIIIEKYLGCNHITCVKCRYQFCWVCFSKWGPRGCPKRCPLYSKDNHSDVNMRFWPAINLYLTAPIHEIGHNSVINFLLFYHNRNTLGFFYYFLFLPFLLSQILGFGVILAIMILAMVIYVYSYLLWVVYFDTMKVHYDRLGNLYDAGCLKAGYFIFLWIFRLPFAIIDSILSISVMIIFFAIIYIRYSCKQDNCWFFLQKLNFNVFRTFCIMIDPEHRKYRGRNHGFEVPRVESFRASVYSFRFAVGVIICIQIIDNIYLNN